MEIPHFQLTWSTSTQVLLAMPHTSLPWRLLLPDSHWAWAGVTILATSPAELTVVQKCFSAKNREGKQTHRLCPQEAGKRSAPPNTPPPSSSSPSHFCHCAQQQLVASSFDKMQKDAWQPQEIIDQAWSPAGYGASQKNGDLQGLRISCGSNTKSFCSTGVHRIAGKTFEHSRSHLAICKLETVVEPSSEL